MNDRDKAIVIGLTDIDSDMGKYEGKKPGEQKARLEVALDRAGLSLTMKDELHNKVPVDGTRLRAWLLATGKQYKSEGDWVGDIFQNGSMMVTEAYREKLGYTKQMVPTALPQVPFSSFPLLPEPGEDQNLALKAPFPGDDAASPEFSPLSSSQSEGTLAQEEAAINKMREVQTGMVPGLHEPSEELTTPSRMNMKATVPDETADLQAESSQLRPAEPPLTSCVANLTANEGMTQDPPSTNTQVFQSTIVPNPAASRQGDTPSGENQSLLAAQGLVAELTLPSHDVALASDFPSSERGKRRPGVHELLAPDQKRQKRVAESINSREVTGMPAPIPEGTTIEMLIDLEEGLPRPPHMIPNLKSPANRNIDDRLDTMKTKISKVGSGYCRQSVAGLDTKPALVPMPTERLRHLYMILFGQNEFGSWRACADHVLREAYDGSVFLEGVIGAAVYDMVFARPVPWGSPWDEIERFKTSGRAPYYTEAAKDLGLEHSNQDYLILRAAELQIGDPRFQNSIIRPIAKNLAEELAMFLYPQLEAMGISNSQRLPGLAFWNKTSAGLVDIFTEGLIVRGQLEVAPSQYRYSWILSGEKYDEETMNHEPMVEAQAGEVSFSITPLVECKQKPSSEWHVVSKAAGQLKVLTRERRADPEPSTAGLGGNEASI